jgi:hypothetical protein
VQASAVANISALGWRSSATWLSRRMCSSSDAGVRSSAVQAARSDAANAAASGPCPVTSPISSPAEPSASVLQT